MFIKIHSVGVIVFIGSYFSHFIPHGSHVLAFDGWLCVCVSGEAQGCLLCDQKQTDSCWYHHCCSAECYDSSSGHPGSFSSLPSCPSGYFNPPRQHEGSPFPFRNNRRQYSPCLQGELFPSHYFL